MTHTHFVVRVDLLASLSVRLLSAILEMKPYNHIGLVVWRDLRVVVS